MPVRTQSTPTYFFTDRVNLRGHKAFDRHNDSRKSTELCCDTACECGLIGRDFDSKAAEWAIVEYDTCGLVRRL